MANYRRYYVPGALVFITAVTNKRTPIFQTKTNVDLLWETLKGVQQIYSFHLLAYVILPDHIHWIMKTQDQSGNFSQVMQSIKRNYTRNYKKINHISSPLTIWQSRFWDHIIRNEKDLENHFDYIHWNPVKHGHIQNPEAWPYSSLSFWQNQGYYPASWGCNEMPDNILDMEYE